MIEISPGMFCLLLVLPPVLLAAVVCLKRVRPAVSASGENTDIQLIRTASEGKVLVQRRAIVQPPDRSALVSDIAAPPVGR